MDSNIVFDRTSLFLAEKMKESAYKQSMHAYNIANASTPGYKPLVFDEELQKAITKQDKEFNLEAEIGAMSEDRLRHSTYVKVLSIKSQIMKKIVTMGKGG